MSMTLRDRIANKGGSYIVAAKLARASSVVRYWMRINRVPKIQDAEALAPILGCLPSEILGDAPTTDQTHRYYLEAAIHEMEAASQEIVGSYRGAALYRRAQGLRKMLAEMTAGRRVES
jgi:hypothetical protein